MGNTKNAASRRPNTQRNTGARKEKATTAVKLTEKSSKKRKGNSKPDDGSGPLVNPLTSLAPTTKATPKATPKPRPNYNGAPNTQSSHSGHYTQESGASTTLTSCLDLDAARTLMDFGTGSRSTSRVLISEEKSVAGLQGDGEEEVAALDIPDMLHVNSHADNEEVDEEDDDSSEDDSSDDEVLDIKYQVPNGTACKNIVLSNKTTWGSFVSKIAEGMGTRPTLLFRLGYVFSWLPKNPKPRPMLLTSENEYGEMPEGIEERLSKATRSDKKGKKTPSYVIISDESDTKPSGSNSSKTKTRARNDENSLEPAITEEDATNSITRIIEKIEGNFHCREHDRACVIEDSGYHYQLTNEDLSVWAKLVHEHLTSIDRVPDKLNYEADCKEESSLLNSTLLDVAASYLPREAMAYIFHLDVKSTRQKRLKTAARPDINPWMSYGPPPPWFFQPPVFPSYAHPSVSGTPSTLPSTNSVPSSSAMASPSRKRRLHVTYPLIGEWLTSLDADPIRGEDMVYFEQYADTLAQEGILRLGDLHDLKTPEKLMDILPSIRWGIANRLMKFAMEDIDSYEQEAKRNRTE
ncbi:hypothetical protein K435DRAFT_873091 [Dendrothele bispora CBS 962.96]|uniref:Uncharacterized protein n=1 Tax=Dendrothele bispora (strain CBS 962.96) TaxID=1314807 RepID=A0A4S8KZX3_DENBC|nr:hypothetical protein K435DRAFT_873091 [Dendrothele bispora CBS 962.96]